MDYFALKLVHQAAAALSVTGFVARGIGALAGATWVRTRLVKTLPHVVDTVLLVSALTLAWTLRLTPTQNPWLLAKIIALLVYIGLGMLALKPGHALSVRTGAFVGALLCFAYIVSVAMTKSPLGLLSRLA